MRQFQQVLTIIFTLTMTVAVGALAYWLVTNKPSVPKAEKPVPAANVAKVIKEEDLNTVVLSEAAEKRIGLKLASIEQKPVQRVRVYGGEVTIPVGRTIIVSAPLSGTLKPPRSGVPLAGSVVKTGQPIFQLLPLLTPDGRATLSASLADANGQVNTAKASFELTDIAVKRAERVLQDGAGSQRQVDEARAAYDVAKKTLEAAVARQSILSKVVGDADGGTAAPIPIVAPEDGILRVVSALSGQTVPSGAALFEVVDLSTVWVRVPLPVGDLDQIDRTKPALAGKLSSQPGAKLLPAKAVIAPPSANPLASTVDLFFELANSDGKLSPGQRLGVSISLSDSQESLVVPWSAIVFDVNGNTWIYVESAPRTYARKRVVVKHTSGELAVLATGPSVGTLVVVQGTQELFGAETGFIK